MTLVARLFAVFAVMLTLGLAVPAAAQNPLTGGRPLGGAPPPAEQAAPPRDQGGWLAQAGRAIAAVQKTLVDRIAREVKALKDGQSYWPLAVGIAFAFLYGVLHTLGPGHGKFVIVSYFVGREASVWRGLVMASQIALTHVIAAVILVWLTDAAVRLMFGASTGELYWTRLISYAVLAAIGLWMLLQAVAAMRGRAQPVGHGHQHHPHAGRQQGLLSLGVGLAPCTGAILVMLFAIANDVLFAGAIMVGAIGLGMALTMFVIGVAAILARGALVRRLEHDSRRVGRWQTGLEFTGALVIVLFSTALLVDAL